MLFGIEDIIEKKDGGAYDQNGTSLKSTYSNLIYENENTVRKSF